jgi:hypothetical protein
MMQEIAASRQLQITTAACIISIAFFNFFGISVTKKLSGASRCTIDACRTLFVWVFSLWAGWENFHILEVFPFSHSSLSPVLAIEWSSFWKLRALVAHWNFETLYIKACAPVLAPD